MSFYRPFFGTKIEASTEAKERGASKVEVDEILKLVEERLGERERAVERRWKALADAKFDVEHLLDLMTDLGHPAVAERMRTRLKASGVL